MTHRSGAAQVLDAGAARRSRRVNAYSTQWLGAPGRTGPVRMFGGRPGVTLSRSVYWSPQAGLFGNGAALGCWNWSCGLIRVRREQTRR